MLKAMVKSAVDMAQQTHSDLVLMLFLTMEVPTSRFLAWGMKNKFARVKSGQYGRCRTIFCALGGQEGLLHITKVAFSTTFSATSS
jgi:hypothetical protein